MALSAREEILQRLRAAAKEETPPRPEVPPMPEVSMDREGLVRKFTEVLAEEAVEVHRVQDIPAALNQLARIAREEGLKSIMASTDDVIAPLDLKTWGQRNGIQVMTPLDFSSRDAFKDAVFDRADAGVTGADFAVAESGTLGLIHNRDQARLVSLAPILHIALVPVERIVPVYERVMEKVFAEKNALPSQFAFITGPSMTGDIQGVLFKGMHGPRKVIIILLG